MTEEMKKVSLGDAMKQMLARKKQAGSRGPVLCHNYWFMPRVREIDQPVI